MRRINFLVPSLEPGRDGVGDYARRIGEELVDRGWAAQWIALHDAAVAEVKFGPDELRLPAVLPWRARAKLLHDRLDDSPGGWLSLQWVGFGFARRGIPWPLASLIARARTGRQLHLYLHEIWLGEKPGLPWSQRLLGRVQRWWTRRAVARWRPDLVQTSNSLYSEALRREGIEAEVLPLPGNLPIAGAPEPRGDARSLRVALFGSLDPEWSSERFVQALEKWAEERQRVVELVSIGQQGSGAPIWRDLVMRLEHSSTVSVRATGFIAPREVSLELLRADLGATTKSFELLGKSGAFAALTEHGLPVVALRSPREARWKLVPETWTVPVCPFERTGDDTFGRWLDESRRRPPAARLPAVADALVAAFERGEGMQIESAK